MPQVPDGGFARSPSDRSLAVARSLQRLQRARDGTFADGLFADPAWEILLDLFVSQGEARRLSVSAACVGINGSSATGLRYLGMLQERGIVSREPDGRDGRRHYVALTETGFIQVERLLEGHAPA